LGFLVRAWTACIGRAAFVRARVPVSDGDPSEPAVGGEGEVGKRDVVCQTVTLDAGGQTGAASGPGAVAQRGRDSQCGEVGVVHDANRRERSGRSATLRLSR